MIRGLLSIALNAEHPAETRNTVKAWVHWYEMYNIPRDVIFVIPELILMSEPEPAMDKAAQLSAFRLLRVAAQRCWRY